MKSTSRLPAHIDLPLPSPPQQTCAVCLEDFKGKDELGVLPCQHAFHRKYVGMGWGGMGGPEEDELGSVFKTLLIPTPPQVLFNSALSTVPYV